MYHEADDSFYVGISRSRSEKMLFIESGEAADGLARALGTSKPCFPVYLHLASTSEHGIYGPASFSETRLNSVMVITAPECRLLAAGSAVTSEIRYLRADTPLGDFAVILPRVTDVEYRVSHRGDAFFLLLRDPSRWGPATCAAQLVELLGTV